MENYTIILLAFSFKIAVLISVCVYFLESIRWRFLLTFGFIEAAIRSYHSAEHKLCVWLQTNKTTLIH